MQAVEYQLVTAKMVAHISSNPNSSPFLQLADYKHFAGDTQMKNGVPLHSPDGILRFSGDTRIQSHLPGCTADPTAFGASRGLSRRLPGRTGNGRNCRRRAVTGRNSADKKVSRKFSQQQQTGRRYFQLSTDSFTVAPN